MARSMSRFSNAMRRRSSFDTSSRNAGFALILVLWCTVLLSFIITHVITSGKTELRISSNILANTVAREAADRAIFETIFRQSAMKSEQHRAVDGGMHEIVVGESRITVKLED